MDLGLGTPSQTLENDAKTDSGINVEGDDESQTPVPGDGNVTPKRKDLTREVQTNQDSNDSHLSKSSAGSHLSPEEKDRYAFISEQLTILNNSNTGFPTDKRENKPKTKNTGSSKGPFSKVVSPLKRLARGIKRTHRKSTTAIAKKLKLQQKDDLETAGKPLTQSDFENGSNDDDDDDDSSSDGEKWRIFEESEEEIDRTLEDKADSFKLSALNVKSIIHKIITDEHVLKMVQNSVETGDDGDKDHEDAREDDGSLTFEPKMTRSKVKDFLQKQGSVPHPWGLSPVKRGSPSFLDIDLPEDEEEDEDFNPEKVPVVDSDEDSESVMSSNVSDLGSPMPSTPRTPSTCATPTLSHRYTDTEDSQSLFSPMGPPTQLPRSCQKSMLGQKFQDAVSAEEARRNQEEEELIALRTRSKYPMTDTTILELEANFVAPDITEDMYETQCDDTEWESFLQSLVKVETPPKDSEDSVKDTEDDDPEYNYLEEEEQEYDKEDFRDDRAVKVSKKELNMLMDELYEAYGDMDPIDKECKSAIKAQSRHIVQSAIRRQQAQTTSVWRITEYERKQIDDQMRKHVQLLTQLYLLCRENEPEHQAAGETAKMLLNELHTFATRQETAFPDQPTVLRACTLEQAHAIVNDPDIFKEREPAEPPEYSKERSKRAIFKFESLTLPPLTFPQMNVMWTSPVFMYPQLLPHGGLFKSDEVKKDRSRVKFLECEDNLLALGLEQFRNFPNGREIIQQLLLPTKTKKQISIRIKNLSAKAAKENPVKYYRTYKQLPSFPSTAPSFKVDMMKAPRDQSLSPDALPNWCKVFLSPNKDSTSKDSVDGCCSNSDCIQRKSGSLSSLSGPSQTGSTPTTPLSTGTESTLTGSSGSSGKSMDMKLIKRPGKRRLYNQKISPSKKKGTFVPLKSSDITSAHIMEDSISPIRIYVVDKMPVSSSGVTLTQPVSMTTGSRASPVVTCVAPTIVLVNSAITRSGMLAVTSTSAGTVVSSPIVTSRSTPNFVSHGDPPSDRSDEIQSRSSPHLQKEIYIEGNGNLNENSGQHSDVQPEVGEGHIAEEDSTNVKSVIRSNADLEKVSPQEQKTTSEIESVTTPNKALSSSSAVRQPASPADSVTELPGGQQKLTSDLLEKSATNVLRAETPTNENVAVAQGQCTPVLVHPGMRVSQEGTPDSVDYKSKDGTPVSKSAIEIMASFAPYFISPSVVTSQELKCQCTSVSKYRPVIPKLFTSSSAKPVSPFLDKSRCSPRKKQLQQKARSILPKGFVRSTFTSPSKKAASSLIDKAKGMKSPRGRSKRLFSPQKTGTGFRKILPNPIGLSKSLDDMRVGSLECDRHEIEDDIDSQKDTASEYDTQESEMMSDDLLESNDNDDDFEAAEDNENFNNNAGDEKCVDTESEDTQSEDGNETQDDGDSQEENMDVDDDEHMATLMEASTSLGFKPTKVTGGLSSLKAKRHRHRDLTLALLAPDIVESDPYRDERDTAFAQAYLLKVKKALRDDLDRYEKFLRIMYEFNKSGLSPVKLYSDLSDIFKDYPELLHDFAGFLLPEQAVECSCFLPHQEFVRARMFLRKLEIYFSKTPSQFQKIMRAFTRWYKKPSRKLEDLRSQVEPMLRGQRYLLDEFSLFFPNDKPPESVADEYEEIDFEKSDDESKFDGFEEVELPDEREPQGTKRCQCQCHSTGDDTYRKRKKHCLSCCLTVIDGELVYRINSKTIKKINVTLGPPVKPLPTERGEITDTTSTPAVTEPESIETVEELSDTEAAEKENIENFEESSQKAEAARVRVANKLHLVSKSKQSKGLKDFYPWKKSSFLQRVSSWSRKSKFSNKGSQHSSGSDTKIPSEQNSSESSKSQDSVNEINNQEAQIKDSSKSSEDLITETSKQNISSSVVSQATSSKTDFTITESTTHLTEVSENGVTFLSESSEKVSNNTEVDKSPEKRPLGSSSDSIMASDILARAFSSAILGEVSLDSSSVPFGTSQGAAVKISSASNQTGTLQEPKPSRSSSSSKDITFGNGPEGQVNFTVSSDSSFSKIKKSGSSGFLVDENLMAQNKSTEIIDSNLAADTSIISKSETETPDSNNLDSSPESNILKTATEANTRNVSGSSPRSMTETPLASPFSPFSPFAQEIQNITSAKSPFACIKSPNVSTKKQATPKLRRITPIRVQASDVSEDESSTAFQVVAQNSPIISDLHLKSPVEKSTLERYSSSESLNKTPVPSNLIKDTTLNSDIKEVPGNLDKPVLLESIEVTSGSASNSQKSIQYSSSQKSVESLQSGSQKSGNSAESESFKSDVSEKRTSPVVISQPVTYSEDANEAFIKPVINDEAIVNTGMLSENSLLGLVKGSHLGHENLHTISNLTNILTALEQSPSKVEHKQPNKVEKSVRGEENVKMPSVESKSKSSPGEYVPQTATSIENLDRLKHLDIKVSRLSDSDESCSKFAAESDKGLEVEISKTSLILDKSIENPLISPSDISSSHTSQLDYSSLSEKDNDKTTKRTVEKFVGDQFTYLDDTTVVESQGSEVTLVTDDELIKDNRQNDSGITQVVSDLNFEESEENELTQRSSRAHEKSAERTNRTSSFIKSPLNSSKKVSASCRSSGRISKSKQITETENYDSKGSLASSENSNSCSRTRSSTSFGEDNKIALVGRKSNKDIVKSTRKDVKMTEVKNQKYLRRDSKFCKAKSNTSQCKSPRTVVKLRKSLTTNKADSCAEIDPEKDKSAKSGSRKHKHDREKGILAEPAGELRPEASTSGTGQDVHQDTSSSSVDESGIDATEEEVVWTKAMDETILEGCKVHGPKDKTFTKIAKQIGQVTAKQVQKRFHRLLTLLLESGSEDEGS